MSSANKPKKIPRRDGLDSQFLTAAKVSGVVRDNVAAPAGKCQLEDEIIVWIWQKRTPEKENVLQMRTAGKVSQEAVGVSGALSNRQMFRPAEDVQPLGIKPDGEANLKMWRRNGRYQSEAGASPGTGSGHKEGSIENHSQSAKTSAGNAKE